MGRCAAHSGDSKTKERRAVAARCGATRGILETTDIAIYMMATPAEFAARNAGAA
jgi:hypothetical protein